MSVKWCVQAVLVSGCGVGDYRSVMQWMVVVVVCLWDEDFSVALKKLVCLSLAALFQLSAYYNNGEERIKIRER